MSARAVLNEARRQGIAIRARDGGLQVRTGGRPIPPALDRMIRSEKLALLRVLTELEEATGAAPHPDEDPADPPFAGSIDGPQEDPDDLPAHSWPITPEERESIRFIEAWNAGIDREADERQQECRS